MSVSRGRLVLVASLALLFGAAPTVGDLGSCGDTATDIDEQGFASARKSIDCLRCGDCKLKTQTCQGACDPNAPSAIGWPSTCHPLQHDGDVCLRALQAASCTSYASYVDDQAPTVPTECDFCRMVGASGAGPGE